MYKQLKRITDFLASTLILSLLLPIFVPCIIILLITGEHDVFYLQERVGYRCRSFSIFKFVTMMRGSLNIGSEDITIENDPRVFPFGKLLRKTKIDELPQFMNVLIGSMSLVGPRPLTQNTFNYYSDDVQNIIGKMKPGITGVGSVIFRNEEKYKSSAEDSRIFYRNFISPYKGELEMWYADNASFFLDLKLILITVWVLLSPESSLPHKWLKGLPEKPLWMS